jgi:outer membrane lipoprotein SlyB
MLATRPFAKRLGVLLLTSALVAPNIVACSTRSGATYTPDEAGTAMEVTRASILQSRAVVIEGLRSDQAAGWGTAVGATVAGAAAYGLTRADTPLGVAVTIIAAIGGALVGTIAEEQKNKWPGAEYILAQSDGTSKAIVQVLARDETIIPPGEQVAIIHGRKGFYRVVPVK